LQHALPEDPHMSQILRQLSAAEARSGVEIDSIGPATPAPVGAGTAVAISLAVKGHYFALQNFLRILRNGAYLDKNLVKGSGRLYGVDGIQFSGGSSAGNAQASQTQISASLTVQAYLYDGSTAATIPAPVATSSTGS
jgi:hypothetical protein